MIILILAIGTKDLLEVSPITKRKHETREGHDYSYITSKIEDFGKTIYVRDQERVAIELEYQFTVAAGLKKEILQHKDSIQYFIEYKNNKGKKHRIKINNISSYRYE